MKHLALLVVLGASMLGAASAQQASTNDVATLREVQLVVSRDCETARRIVANSAELAKLEPDSRQEMYIAVEQCAVEERNAFNEKEPQKQEIVVVAPDKDGKIFFKSVRKSDAEAIANACTTISRAAIALIPDLSVQTAAIRLDAGKVNCEALLKSAANDNPLVILAPNYVTGPAMTVAALRAIGLKKPAAEIQKHITEIDQRIGEISRETGAEIKKHPLILVAGPAGVAATAAVKAVGKDMCRLKIRCKKFKCRHSCS